MVAATIGLDEGAQENAHASIAVPLKLLHVRVELNAPPLRRCLAQAGKAKACMHARTAEEEGLVLRIVPCFWKKMEEKLHT